MKKSKGFTFIEMMIAFTIIGILLAIAVPEISRSMSGTPKTEKKDIQSQKAKEAAESIRFTENAEIDNIKRRLELTSNPGLLGYVVLLNEMGQPVLYTAVKGKLTSGGKRLTKGQRSVQLGRNTNGAIYALGQSPSDEGTWGKSNPYVYFWDVNGAYHQWNGKYLYSDKPIRLREDPLVIGIGKDVK